MKFSEEGWAQRKLGVNSAFKRTPFEKSTGSSWSMLCLKPSLFALSTNMITKLVMLGWFKRDELPPLSGKVTAFEINKMLDAAFNNQLIFD